MRSSFATTRIFFKILPKTYWPLIHFPATSLSPHRCTVGPSPIFLVFCLQLCFSFPSQFLFCVSLTVSHSTKQKVTNLFFTSSIWHLLFFTSPLFISRPFSSHLVPDASSTCVSTLCCTGVYLVSKTPVDCHHFVLLHLNKCFSVLITAFDLGTHAPITSAAVAVPVPNRIATLLIVIHVCVSNASVY